MEATEAKRAETGTVLKRGNYRLDVIRNRLAELERSRQISGICREINVSRNTLYLVARGETNVSEDMLRRILRGIDLTWEMVVSG